MGWTKYYEDNEIICIAREVMRDSRPTYYRQVTTFRSEEVHAKEHLHKENAEQTVIRRRQQGRRGLELNFQKKPDSAALRKLQMNGWWWSKGNVCWCNLDTRSNRSYVESSLKTYEPSISVVAYCD